MIKPRFIGEKISSNLPVVGHLFFTDDDRYFISPKGNELFGLRGINPDEHIVMAGWIEVDLESVRLMEVEENESL